MKQTSLRVSQRLCLFALMLAISGEVVAQQHAHASQKPTYPSCRTFAQNFYDWYVPIALKDRKEPASNIAIRTKPDLFTPELLQLLKRDSLAQSRSTEIVGLDFDPFLNSQDPSERFQVENVKWVGTTCLVTVRGYSSGEKQETVTPEIKIANGHWVFVDFHYQNGHLKLTRLLQQLEAERTSHGAKR